MDIGGWLRGLGLERYEQAFRENEIDLRVLPELTADDLKELGVAAIGHRRLLLKAIADLAASAGRAAAEDVPAASPASAPGEAERRQLTVMFCDLVGSTALAAQLDPEDLREVISAYHRATTDAVGAFGGFVAKYMGDGVGDAAMVDADDLAQILGIEAGGQRRRTDQVAKHDCELPPLGLGCGVRRGRSRHLLRRGTPGPGHKISDRLQQ